MDQINGTWDQQIPPDIKKNIENLYNQIDQNTEFEFKFFNYTRDQDRMGLENFLKILEYLNFKSKSDKTKLVNQISLDIIYSPKSDKNNNYRITIYDLDTINKYIRMLHERHNHVIFSVLLSSSESDKNINIIKKIKARENIIDIPDFELRVRSSTETKISESEFNKLKSLDESARGEIIFRYKQRVSLFLEQGQDLNLSIDLTNIKMSNILNKMENIIPTYELELDLSYFSKKKIKLSYLKLLYSETNLLLKLIQNSNFLTTKTLESEILDSYTNLLNLDKTKMVSLEARKTVSLEIQNVVDQLPNIYSITDKADGERYFLIIYKNSVFLISDLLRVKNTGIILKSDKYNNTILDGELIFIAPKNRYIFMAFDCLFKSNQDIRQTASLRDRLTNLDEIINSGFVFGKQKNYKSQEYSGKFAIAQLIKFHTTQIKSFMDILNFDIDLEKKFLLVRRKYFIIPTGAQNNEIFKYSELIWNKYVYDKNIACPYILDGLIYNPLEQKYIVSVKESKYADYKWKPPEKNSIDFYIKFERDRTTGKILTLYDNTNLTENFEILGKPYKIINLFVGKLIRGFETPVDFEPESDSTKNIAHLYLADGETRDLYGNIIQDHTVVEFYYKTDPNIPDKNRWIPIRTRYDKTESVQRFGKKFGNYQDTAYKIWRSIKNPFTMADIIILNDDPVYQKHMDILRGKIDHTIILSERKENIYYQIKTTIGKPMRNFHNWIKSILLYTYCNPLYEHGKKLSVLDIGCGRGEGRIQEFYYVQVDFYVGLDPDNESLISPIDGAISRYNQFKKNKPNVPRMYFINADAAVPLNYPDQIKALGGTSNKNSELIQKFFSDKPVLFDRINSLLTIHNFLGSKITWDNFKNNIKKYLKPGGIIIITAFDSDRIFELLKNQNQFISYYTNNSGEQQILFEIIKKYSESEKSEIGLKIDYYNSLEFQEGEYKTIYLITKDFLVSELYESDLELIETDLFENQYIIHKNYFLTAVDYEDNPDTKKFLKNVAEYYTNSATDIGQASYQLTRLYRFYIFRKFEKINQSGGFENFQSELLSPNKYIWKNLDNNNNTSFLESILDIFKNGKIIPVSLGLSEFLSDINSEPFLDNYIDNNISDFLKNIKIIHKSPEEDKIILDGLNILVITMDNKINQYQYNYKINNKINQTCPTILLYFDNNKYSPIYKKNNNNNIGLFDSRIKFIRELIKKFELK